MRSNLYTSFGYFEDRHDDERVLTNIFDSLRPGGTTVIDVVGKELQGRRGDRIIDLPDGSTCIQRIQVVDEWTTLKGEWFVVRGDPRADIASRTDSIRGLNCGKRWRQAASRSRSLGTSPVASTALSHCD